MPAERSMQPVAVAFADNVGVVSDKARIPLTVRYQSFELLNEQYEGDEVVLPLAMFTLTPDKVRTDATLTVPTWLSDTPLTVSTVPLVPVASEIEKHRLPLTVNPPPLKLPVVMHNWGDVVDDVTSVMVPPRPLPLSVLPRNDSEPPLNVMLVDGSHGPEVGASLSESFAKKVKVEDPGVKVKVAGPERPSLHKVEKIVEHDVEVWAMTAEFEEPTDPAEGAVANEDVPGPRARAVSVPDATVTDTGTDAAKSLVPEGM